MDIEQAHSAEGSYARLVQHRRFYISNLSVSGRRIPSQGGDLIVARRDESPDIDWELVHRTTEHVSIEPAPYDVHLDGPEGEFSGSALLIRSDGRSLVFRGAGELIGFAALGFE